MELLNRQKIVIENSFVSQGTDFKREFSFTSDNIKISFITPIDIIKKIDYFKIKFKDIKDKGIVDDVITMEDEYLDLDNMQVLRTATGQTCVRLVYSGIASKLDKIRILYKNDLDLTSNIWSTVPTRPLSLGYSERTTYYTN